jgi:hypothetical protein
VSVLVTLRIWGLSFGAEAEDGTKDEDLVEYVMQITKSRMAREDIASSIKLAREESALERLKQNGNVKGKQADALDLDVLHSDIEGVLTKVGIALALL